MPRKKVDSSAPIKSEPAGETTIEKPKTKTAKTVKTPKAVEKKPEKEITSEVVGDKSEKSEEKVVSSKKGEIFYGTGRRKTSIAGVWMKMEKGEILINGKPIKEYFTKSTEEKI